MEEPTVNGDNAFDMKFWVYMSEYTKPPTTVDDTEGSIQDEL